VGAGRGSTENDSTDLGPAEHPENASRPYSTSADPSSANANRASANPDPVAPVDDTPSRHERLGSAFAKLWTASTTSAVGSGLATVATPLFVASRTNNPLVVSAAATITWLPWLLFALPGGVLVDRLDRRRVMIVIDWVRVAALAVLGAALVADRASVALLYVVLFLISVGEVTFRSASQAFVPDLVPRRLLERANGWLAGGSMLTAGLVAGPLGGFLYAVTPSLPFLANAGTYTVSAILLGLIGAGYARSRKTRAPMPTKNTDVPGPRPPIDAPNAVGADVTPSVWADMVGGLRWLVRQRLLRTMAVLIGLLNVTLTAAMSVLVLLAKERLHLGSVGYGALFSCLAVGGLVGSAFGDRLIGWVTATWTIRIGLVVEAATHLVLATSRSSIAVGAVFVAFGVHGALWTIASVSLRQRLTPPEMLGRVGSATLFVSAGGNCVGAILGGALATNFGLTAPYWVGFVVAVVVAAMTWRVFDRATVTAAYASPTVHA